MPADDTTHGRLSCIMSPSSRSASSAGAGGIEDSITVPVRLLVSLEKPAGCEYRADGTAGGKIWTLICARLFLAHAFVDDAGASSCELNYCWTIERSERGRE